MKYLSMLIFTLVFIGCVETEEESNPVTNNFPLEVSEIDPCERNSDCSNVQKLDRDDFRGLIAQYGDRTNLPYLIGHKFESDFHIKYTSQYRKECLVKASHFQTNVDVDENVIDNTGQRIDRLYL